MSHKQAKAIRKELKGTKFTTGTEEINLREKKCPVTKRIYVTSTIRHKVGTARRTYQDLK